MGACFPQQSAQYVRACAHGACEFWTGLSGLGQLQVPAGGSEGVAASEAAGGGVRVCAGSCGDVALVSSTVLIRKMLPLLPRAALKITSR